MNVQDFFPFRSAKARAEYLALYNERAKTWPVESETRLVDTPSGQTFVRICGRPDNPPLVLLPGSLGTSLTWTPNIASLREHYRTFALDSIYDFGLSIRRRRLSKPEDLLNWLDEVLRVLIPQGKLNLGGLSYGGWLACLYAQHFPERIHKLVLLTPAATVLPVSPRLIFRALLALIPLPGFRRQFYHWLLNDLLRSGEAGRVFVDEAVTDWDVAARTFQPMPLIGATVLTDEQLAAFKVPALFLIGEHEKVYPAQKAVNRLNTLAPQFQTAIIPGAGHDLWAVQAGMVNRLMLEFLGNKEI